MTPEEAAAFAAEIGARAGALTETDPALDVDAFVAARIDLSEYSSLFSFGDSLLDSGLAGGFVDLINDVLPFDAVDDITPSSQGYVEDRFSDGPNFGDRLYAEITGTAPLSYPTIIDVLDDAIIELNGSGLSANGVNFALGGSTALTGGALEGLPEIPDFGIDVIDELVASDLAAQVDQYVDAQERADGAAPADALFLLAFGGNDQFSFIDDFPDFEFPPEEVDALAASIADAYRDGLEALLDVGARNFLVAGAPNAGVAPNVSRKRFDGDVEASVAAVQPVVDAVNARLFDEVAALAETAPDAEFYVFAPDGGVVVADPEAFGLDPDLLAASFVDDLAAGDATLDDLSSYAFIDDFHVTQPGQEQLFEQALAAERVDARFATAEQGGASNDRLVGGAQRDVIGGAGGADTLIGRGGDDVVAGGSGADQIRGLDGADLLIGDAGADTLSGGGGGDAMAGGSGDDLMYGGQGDDTLTGENGDDRALGNAGFDLIDGAEGADTLAGGDQGDTLIGRQDDDVLRGQSGFDRLSAGWGDDLLQGGFGADTLIGGFGDDTLDGGTQNDRLAGNEGRDLFVIRDAGAAQRDTILDFAVGEDRIDLRGVTGGLDADGVAAILADATALDDGTRLRIDPRTEVDLRGVDAAALSVDDFLF